jgi:hypothetical protein
MKRIIIFFFVLSLMACDDGFQTKVEDGIEQTCNGLDSCKINMSEIMTFDWDKMYVFKSGATLEQINEVIGFEYPYFEDIAYRVIFTKSNSVVFHEDDFPYPENKAVRKINFAFPNNSINYLAFKRDSAVFTVKKNVYNNEGSYILSLAI